MFSTIAIYYHQGNINTSLHMKPLPLLTVLMNFLIVQSAFTQYNVFIIPLQLPQPYATAPTEGIPGVTAELKAQVTTI